MSSRRRTDHGGSGALLHLLRFSSCFFVDGGWFCLSRWIHLRGFVLFTSGSTGVPKAPLRSERLPFISIYAICGTTHSSPECIEHRWQLSFSLAEIPGRQFDPRKSFGLCSMACPILSAEPRGLKRPGLSVKIVEKSRWNIKCLVSLWGPCATYGGSLLWCFHGGLRAARFWGGLIWRKY